MDDTSMIEFFGPPIDIYTRAQALEDGVLVDVTATAKEAGIRLPVAMGVDLILSRGAD